MYVILRDGRVIEHATLSGASNGERGMQLFIHARDGGYGWYSQEELQTIRFDRDTVEDPAPDPGPEDFKIGIRHQRHELD